MVAQEWVNIYSKYFIEMAKIPRRHSDNFDNRHSGENERKDYLSDLKV